MNFKYLLPGFLFLILTSCAKDLDDNIQTQEPLEVNENVEIYNDEEFFKGYTLVAPVSSNNIYLIDMEGFPVHSWTSLNRGIANYLTPEGDLLRTYVVPNDIFSFGGRTGGIERFDYEGNLIWSWELSNDLSSLHHDLAILPNGNILASVWDFKDADEAIANGRNPELLLNDSVWPDRIIEIKPIGSNDAEIVWQWSIWDHLIQDFDATKLNFGEVAANPQRVDINFTIGDANFNHVNSLFYIEDFDQIVFSSRRFSELMIIDHSTTTLEAAGSSGGNYGKGGDLLYRWGNPQTYKVGDENDQKLTGQHDVRYIGGLPSNGGGNFMCFNNTRTETMSSVEEINIPINGDGSYNLQPNTINLPTDYAWSYTSSDILAPRVSGATRFINGNTLITQGTEGVLLEINSDSEVVWKYKIPLESNDVFKCFRYPLDYPAFESKDLSPKNIILE